MARTSAALVAALYLTTAAAEPGASPRPTSSAELRLQVEAQSKAVTRALSSRARAARRRSLTRFFDSVTARCGATGAGAEDCLRDQYGYYLEQLRESVYRVDGFNVYETNIYGLQWADDDLQEQDAEHPFIWDLQVIWPRVDAPDDASNPLWGPVHYALAGEVHAGMAQWVAGLWELYLHVRLKALNRCYVSASVESGWYGGGAHPNDDIKAFNWDRATNRQLVPTDIFRSDVDWRGQLLALYRHGLGAASGDLPDDDLAPWVEHGFFVTTAGLTILGHEGRSRVDPLPEVSFSWSQLGPLLLQGAQCTGG